VLVLVAMAILFLVTITQPFVFQYIPHLSVERGWPHQKMAAIYFAVGLMSSFLHAAVLGLLVTAAFLKRSVPRPVQPVNPMGSTA